MPRAKAALLHGPSMGAEVAVTAVVLAVLVASAALFWAAVGLGS